jgi:hypothetical protein
MIVLVPIPATLDAGALDEVRLAELLLSPRGDNRAYSWAPP